MFLELIKKISINTGAIASSRIANVIMMMYFANRMVPNDYASLGIASNVILTFSSLAVLGSGTACVDHLSKISDKNEQHKILTGTFVIVLFLSSIFFVAFFFFNDFFSRKVYSNEYLSPWLKISAISILLASFFSLTLNIFYGLGKPSISTKLQILLSISTVVFQIIFFQWLGPIGSSIGIPCAYAITSVAAYIYFFNLIKIDWQNYNLLESAAHALKLALPFGLSVLCVMPASWIAQILVSKNAHTPVEVASYQIALYWQNILMFFGSSLSVIFLPMLNKMNPVSMEKKERLSLFFRGLLLTNALALTMAGCLFFLSEHLIGFYGKHYQSSGSVLGFSGIFFIFSINALYIGQWVLSFSLYKTSIFTNFVWLAIFAISASTYISHVNATQAIYGAFYTAYAVQISLMTFLLFKKAIRNA